MEYFRSACDVLLRQSRSEEARTNFRVCDSIMAAKCQLEAST